MHEHPRALFAGGASLRAMNQVLACALQLLLLLTGCLGGLVGGECSDEEAATFHAIPQYGNEELVPEDHPYGGCADVLVTSDNSEDVIRHYRSQLAQAGYDVGPTESGPMTTETGESIGSTVFLQATKGITAVNVSAEILTGQPTQFVILVADTP